MIMNRLKRNLLGSSILFVFFILSCKNRPSLVNEKINEISNLYVYDSIEVNRIEKKLLDTFDRKMYDNLSVNLGLCEKDFELYLISLNLSKKNNYPEIYINMYQSLIIEYKKRGIPISKDLNILLKYYLKKSYELDSINFSIVPKRVLGKEILMASDSFLKQYYPPLSRKVLS